MFSSKKPAPRVAIEKLTSLISSNVTLLGDLEFDEGLKVSGVIRGNVSHKPGSTSLLALSAEGRIEGRVSTHDALIDGTIIGDLVVDRLLELHSNARVRGNISYRQLSMENGAVVDGTLHRLDDQAALPVKELPRLEAQQPQPQEA